MNHTHATLLETEVSEFYAAIEMTYEGREKCEKFRGRRVWQDHSPDVVKFKPYLWMTRRSS
jgi:hypothetical protein